MTTKMLRKPRISILASGEGTLAESFAKGVAEGKIAAEIGLLICSKESAPVLKRVEHWNSKWNLGVETTVINNKTHPEGQRPRGQSRQSSEEICTQLRRFDTDITLLLGYMVIANEPFIAQWGYNPNKTSTANKMRAFNFHPGLLPLTAKTYKTGSAALMLQEYQSGRLLTAGHAVHAVAQDVDTGPIFRTTFVPIVPEDTAISLSDRIKLNQQETMVSVATDIISQWHS